MENKDLLLNHFKTNYDTAIAFLKQDNLPGAQKCFKKALEAVIQLIDCTIGSERENYKAKAFHLTQLIEKIDAKIASAPAKPAASMPQASCSATKSASLTEKQSVLEEAIEELSAFPGLRAVKDKVNDLIGALKFRNMRAEANLRVPPLSSTNICNILFLGNACMSAEKRAVAHIVAKIFYAFDVCVRQDVVEIDGSALLSSAAGESFKRAQNAIELAKGGTLFIHQLHCVEREENYGARSEVLSALYKAIRDSEYTPIIILSEDETDEIRFQDSIYMVFSKICFE